MLSLVTFSTVAYSPMARPAAERSLSSLRGYATDYWKESDYAFVGPEAMAVPTDSVEAFVERFGADEPAQARQVSLESSPTRVPGWSVAGTRGSSAEPDYGRHAAAAAVAGMKLAYSSGASMGDMGKFAGRSATQQAKQAMSAAKAAAKAAIPRVPGWSAAGTRGSSAEPDYGRIAATAAAAGMALAYSSGASMGDMGMFDGQSASQQAKQAMSAAKAAIPDYSGIAMATAASAHPAMGKLASAMGRVKPRTA